MDIRKMNEKSQEDILYPRMLVRKARLELLETNSTTVICPKCNQSPVIKYTPNHERTLITCPCGYLHEIEINF